MQNSLKDIHVHGMSLCKNRIFCRIMTLTPDDYAENSADESLARLLEMVSFVICKEVERFEYTFLVFSDI